MTNVFLSAVTSSQFLPYLLMHKKCVCVCVCVHNEVTQARQVKISRS